MMSMKVKGVILEIRKRDVGWEKSKKILLIKSVVIKQDGKS